MVVNLYANTKPACFVCMHTVGRMRERYKGPINLLRVFRAGVCRFGVVLRRAIEQVSCSGKLPCEIDESQGEQRDNYPRVIL